MKHTRKNLKKVKRTLNGQKWQKMTKCHYERNDRKWQIMTQKGPRMKIKTDVTPYYQLFNLWNAQKLQKHAWLLLGDKWWKMTEN